MGNKQLTKSVTEFTKPVTEPVTQNVNFIGVGNDLTNKKMTCYPNWMGDLRDAFPNFRLTLQHLSIPGTHDSASTSLGLSFNPMKRWAQTQTIELVQQLEHGTRQLDLRFGDPNNKLSFVHGDVVIGGDTHLGSFPTKWLEKQIKLIAEWVRKHPREIIILKCKISKQGNFISDNNLTKLAQIIYDNFGNLLITKSNRLKTIKYLQDINQRVYCTWEIEKINILEYRLQKRFQQRLFTSWGGGDIMTTQQLSNWLSSNYDMRLRRFSDHLQRERNGEPVEIWSLSYALPAAGELKDDDFLGNITKIGAMIKGEVPDISGSIDFIFTSELGGSWGKYYLFDSNIVQVDWIENSHLVENCIKMNITKLCGCWDTSKYFRDIESYERNVSCRNFACSADIQALKV